MLRAYFAEHGQPGARALWSIMTSLTIPEICSELEDYIDGLASEVYARLPDTDPDPIEGP